MIKMNCWEVKKCGRQSGGDKVSELGLCQSALSGKYDGINNGLNRGRFCWAVTGNACQAEVADSFTKHLKCLGCGFFIQVSIEESDDFILKPADIKGE